MAMVILLVAGCPRPERGSANIRYPQGWPIKALKLPAGARQLALPGPAGAGNTLTTDGALQGAGSAAERTVWELAFSYAGDEAELVTELEDILKAQGFQRAANWTRAGQRWLYLTPDGLSQVQLQYHDLPAIPLAGTQAWQGYELGICHWKQPRPDLGRMGLERMD